MSCELGRGKCQTVAVRDVPQRLAQIRRRLITFLDIGRQRPGQHVVQRLRQPGALLRHGEDGHAIDLVRGGVEIADEQAFTAE